MVIIRDERRGVLPTYDYRCTKCGREFSAEHGMLEKPLRKCRKCGGRLEKLLPKSLNLIFKGSGFYSTDYKKPEPKPEASVKAEPETKSKAAKEGKEAKKEKDAES
jgi:putative FmdB family regulatory protein